METGANKNLAQIAEMFGYEYRNNSDTFWPEYHRKVFAGEKPDYEKELSVMFETYKREAKSVKADTTDKRAYWLNMSGKADEADYNLTYLKTIIGLTKLEGEVCGDLYYKDRIGDAISLVKADYANFYSMKRTDPTRIP